MRMTKFVLLGTILQLNFGFLMAQTESGSLIKPFGLGLHIEQFKLKDANDFNYAPANRLIFTISPNNSFRLEPEIGFNFGKNKTDKLKNSSISFGLGVLGMIQRNKLTIYSGLRFEYATIKWDNNYNGSILSHKLNRFMFGPAIGCEYYLGDNFTLGGELGLQYALLKSTEVPKPFYYNDQESHSFTTDTGLFIRFYFGK